MCIVVIGKSGQLASELAHISTSESLVFFGRNDIDISSLADIESTLDKYKYVKAIINASAYTAVDKAESDEKTAYDLNELGVKNLALYARDNGMHLVHVSTDYVFDGKKGSPYRTHDRIEPQGIYGASKAAGESALKELVPHQSAIIRTSWVYSEFGNNFVKTMLRLMVEKDELKVIDDQVGSPTWAKGLARACIEAAENKINGVYHWSDEGVCSWYDFAVAIQEEGIILSLLDKRIPINPIPTSQYPTPANRPHYSILDKVATRYDFKTSKLYHWRHQLRCMLLNLKSTNVK